MGFHRQEYWRGLSFPLEGIFLTQASNPCLFYLLHWRVGSSPLSHLESPDHSISSVQFSRSVVPDSLRPFESRHARPPCPSPTPGVHSNSLPSSQWCHPAISSSVVPFSSHLQFFPASGSFQISQFFASGGQSIGVSVSGSGLISFRMDWLDLLAVQGTLKSSPTPQFKSINSSALSFLYSPTLTSIHDYWKNHSLD